MRIVRTRSGATVAAAALFLGVAVALGPVAGAVDGGSITITSPTGACGVVQKADPYPSGIEVGGLPVITDLNVVVSFTHARPDDAALLLVGPKGQAVLLMADAGGVTSVPDATLTFDDEAATGLPDSGPLVDGSYRPTLGTAGGVGCAAPATFPSTAPGGPYGTSLAVFDGLEPTGNWRLFVFDDTEIGGGQIASWRLDFTATEPYVTVLVAGAGSGTVTGIGISCPPDCAQAGVLGSSVTLQAAAASGSVFGGWSGVCTGTGLTCTAALTSPTVTVGALFEPSGSPTPGVDLSVTVAAPADPIAVGSSGTLSFDVANAGPLASSAITLSIDLPSSVEVVTTPAGCSLAGSDLTCTLAGLVVGGHTAVTVQVAPTKNEAFVATASAASGTPDGDPGDNSASVSVDVEAPCTIEGSNASEELEGTSGVDVICGRGGEDVIRGLDGSDILRGGPGRDELHGSLGDDTVLGGGGVDRLFGGQGTDACDAASNEVAHGCEGSA